MKKVHFKTLNLAPQPNKSIQIHSSHKRNRTMWTPSQTLRHSIHKMPPHKTHPELLSILTMTSKVMEVVPAGIIHRMGGFWIVIRLERIHRVWILWLDHKKKELRATIFGSEKWRLILIAEVKKKLLMEIERLFLKMYRLAWMIGKNINRKQEMNLV